jgi:hypothetical protein
MAQEQRTAATRLSAGRFQEFTVNSTHSIAIAGITHLRFTGSAELPPHECRTGM